MLKFYRLLCFLLFVSPAYSQYYGSIDAPFSAWLTGGPDFYSVNSSGLENFAYRYNSDRTSIHSTLMKPPQMLSGYFLGGGFGVDGVVVEFFYAHHTGSMNSEIDPLFATDGDYGRSIDLTGNTFNISSGYLFSILEGSFAVIVPTFEANITSLSFTTKTTNSPNEIKGDIGTSTNFSIGMSFLLNLTGSFYLYVKPSYNIDAFGLDFRPLYEGTSTYYRHLRETTGSFGGFEIKAGIAIVTGCF